MRATSAVPECPDQKILECPLCGTRLRHKEAPERDEVGRDSLMTIARHRCVPRVRSRSVPSASVDGRADPQRRVRVLGR
jgi:hypothetical protein